MNNNKSTVTSALYGTKTADNLIQAFEKEAANYARSSIFSSVAATDGEMSAERTFKEQADNDKRLAELWLSYLDEIGDTFENLRELSIIKDSMKEDFYPFIADIADEEGLSEIAEKLRLAAFSKETHSNILRTESEKISNPDIMMSTDAETPWLCTCCGYVVKGNMPPERCPLCNYPSGCFKELAH